ncbi:hypothetical protein VitviT2T_007767 [Vitis vinifera]|uniref:K Homology domain-containing protein n=3 Tax=Vitis vinifera TaxID=29760 RepID=A0ABY9C0I3_VITVI|eukprot:XP_010651353.1 PREDICTED: extensin isoform X1 [Vitis vinifera]
MTKVDQASAVESRRAQMTGTSTSPAATTSSSRISMFGAKSGFVIPKNKLSGSMVPIFRAGKKLGSSDGANEESTKTVQRKTKWGPDLTQDAAVRRGTALAFQTRVDQITLQLKSGVLEIGDNQDSSLVAQVPDQEFPSHQNNSEKSELLELERREAIGEMLKLNPSYKAPPDYKPLLKEARVPIPVKEYPGYNFIGLIFGPGSDTLKRLEKETGAKVQVYGNKADTGQKVEITPSDGIQGAHEELYLHISAETFEKVDAAVALIELLVTPVSGNPAAVSTTPTSVSGDNVNVHNQSQEVVPTTVVNPGVVQPVSGPSQTPPQGQFQYPGPWFPIGPPPIPMHLPSGFIPPSNPSAQILNNPPHLPSPSFSASNMPSLFGPRPSPAAGFGSVLRNPSPVPLRPQSSIQMLQRPYMPQANLPMLAQHPLLAQPNVSAPLPFPVNQATPLGPPTTGRPSMPLLPQSVPNLLSGPLPDRPITPAGSSTGWPRVPLGTPASLGPNQMVQMTTSMVPGVPRPVVASVAPPSNISAANMVSPVTFSSRPSAPQLPSTQQNRPLTPPTFASVPPPQMGPSPTTPVSLPPAPVPPQMQPLTTPAPIPNPSPRPVLGSTPVPSSMQSSTPPTPLQFGIPSSVSGGIPSFTSVRPPVATLIPQRPSSSDFTFQPHQPLNAVSQAVPMPSGQPTTQNPLPPKPIMQPPMAPQPPSFRVAMHNSTPPATMPPFLRPQVNNQMGPPHSQISAASFPGTPSSLSPMSAPLRPPAFQSPSSVAAAIPVPQRGPGNFNPVRQISNLPGPFPSRSGNAMQLQQNFPAPPARPGNPSAPNQHFGNMSFASPKPASGPHGAPQIYDPFSPTSVPRAPPQQGGNPAKLRKQENDPEYEDLMASVGVK